MKLRAVGVGENSHSGRVLDIKVKAGGRKQPEMMR